ncbi:protein SET-like [Carcharodon carcharias]|uniref:protein SET-like n=1 Tax=Carcharodon carcharias TaxID=13397 RepID=UPI001B7DDEDC|nr:protein SET-like [Carcharodon carcharias]
MSGAPETKLPRLEAPESGDKSTTTTTTTAAAAAAAGEQAKAAGAAAHAPAAEGAGPAAVAQATVGAASSAVVVVAGGGGGAGGELATPLAVARETQRALEAVDACQRELEALNERASEEILRVERRYGELRRPHLERRNRLIEDIPGFWVTAFLNHPQLSALIDENDEEVFNYMMRLEVEEFEDIKSGYRIKFNFSENPYFENNLIIKEFHLGTGGKPVSQSTPIKWKKGMDLTALSKGLHEKGRKRGHRSFFAWFTEHRNPTTDEIAEVLKDDMWPNPLQYFLIAESESGENGLDDSDEENGDDSVVIVDEDEDEEEDEDEDEDDDEVQEIVDEEDEEEGSEDDVEEIDDGEEVEEEGVELEGEEDEAKEGGDG